VSDAHGTVYHFLNPGGGPGYPNCTGCYSAIPDYIEDSNGNQILFSSSGGKATYSDTTGRAAITWNGLGTNGQTNTITLSGTTYQVNWTSTTPTFSFPNKIVYQVQGYNCEPFLPVNTAETVVNSITLPNNETYQFYYGTNNPHGYSNPYGLLSEIDYPTGAWVRYTWKMSDTYSEGVSFDGIGVGGNAGQEVPTFCQSIFQTPVIATRTVGLAGSSTPILTQSFSYSTSWSTTNGGGGPAWLTKQTTVSITDNVRSLTSQTRYTYGPYTVGSNNPYIPDFTANQLPLETSVQYSDWGNTSTIETASKTWLNQFELASDQKTLNGQTSEVTYQYGQSAAQVKLKNEYDYASTPPGSLLRSVVTNYQAFNATPIYPGVPSILDRPCQVITYDGNSKRYAETDYYYDGSAALCPTTASTQTLPGTGIYTGHDETNYGTTSTAPRGNLTQQSQWANAGTSPVTTYTYDETGQVLSKTNPCGNPNGVCSDMTGTNHTTNYSYANNYTVLSSGQNVSYSPTRDTNTYLTSVTDPLGHIESFTYDYNNGQLTVLNDDNSQLTHYLYNDPFSRPKQVNYPDGGQTTLSYGDSSTPSVTTAKLVISGASIVNTTTTDSLGHPVSTLLSSDPDGATYTVATYDGEGKIYLRYNPTRCNPPTTNCAEATWGFTTYTYDALGRTTQVAEPDGSTVGTTYTGNQATVTDEAGTQRTSQIDALGRLTSVWEAPNVTGYNYQTQYQYDPLGNLLCAVQKGIDTTSFTNCASASPTWRPRSFVYDSLSRLIKATNPESGTITYAYDASNNLFSKVAPKPGQTGTTTVTTNYSYDVGDRLLQKSYVGMSTAASKYRYDGTPLSGCSGPTPPSIKSPTNLIGRRSAMCAGLSSSSWSYDPLGRTLVEARTNKGTSAQTYAVGYSYYQDGSLTSLTYPSGDVLYYGIGLAGRYTGVFDASNSYAYFAHYTPPGSLYFVDRSDVYPSSSTSAFTEYNNRLQKIRSTVIPSSTSQPIWGLCYDFHTSQVDSICPFKASSGDNGNVFEIASINQAYCPSCDNTHDAVYTYDPLNRVSQANTVATTGANCWGEVYTLDVWGNLTNRAGVSGMTGCATEGLNAAPASNKNQLNGPLYDAAGNVTNDGTNQPTYDAENRITTVSGVTYSYDGDGVRMEKSPGAMYWPGPSGEILAETDLTGTINEEYIYFDGERIARVDRPSGTVHYYFSDSLGSATIITDIAGNIQEHYYYYPYGGLVSSVGSDPNHYKFTGKERDTESGLDYFGARHYASGMGRFMTPDWSDEPDPIPYASLQNPQTLNLYSYVANNPTTFDDPDGHCWGDTICGFPDPGYIESDVSKKKPPQPDPGCPNLNCVTVTAHADSIPFTDVRWLPLEIPTIERILGVLGTAVRGAAVPFIAVSYLVSPPYKYAQDTLDPEDSSHKDNARESTREKHEEGEARKRKDRGGEKGDARRRPPRKRPDGWKGPWPPKQGQN
jgi:RHS repeat-associated protein